MHDLYQNKPPEGNRYVLSFRRHPCYDNLNLFQPFQGDINRLLRAEGAKTKMFYRGYFSAGICGPLLAAKVAAPHGGFFGRNDYDKSISTVKRGELGHFLNRAPQ